MNAGVKVNGYYVVGGGDAGLTSCLGTYGPITGYIYASSSKFQLYLSGVYSDASCTGQAVNHAINLVGYGALNGVNHYILRNSWGTGWGNYLIYIIIQNSYNNILIFIRYGRLYVYCTRQQHVFSCYV